MKQFTTRLVSFMAILGMVVGLMPAGAAGVDITASNSGQIDDTVGVVNDVTFTWTASSQYQNGDTVVFTFSSAPSTTNISNCSTVDHDIDNNSGTDDGSFGSFSTTQAIYTISDDTQIVSTNVSLCLGVPINASDTGNYSVSIQTTGSVNDVGAVLLYVNGGNDVTVTAIVPATLSFVIRNSSDNTNTNTCDLGTLTTASVNSCAYRLRIGTNATNGFTATITSDGDMNASGNATLTNIGAGTVLAGTEGYGIALTGATQGGRNSTTGNYTEAVTEGTAAYFTFNSDDSPVPTSTSPTIISYTDAFDPGTAPNLTNTTLVTHKAAINSATPAGAYQQVVTYLVTADF